MMITASTEADTHCGWCGYEFETDDERIEQSYGDVHARHITAGETVDEHEDDGDPDGAYDRARDAAQGV